MGEVKSPTFASKFLKMLSGKTFRTSISDSSKPFLRKRQAKTKIIFLENPLSQ
jgi:hypothetical protein